MPHAGRSSLVAEGTFDVHRVVRHTVALRRQMLVAFEQLAGKLRVAVGGRSYEKTVGVLEREDTDIGQSLDDRRAHRRERLLPIGRLSKRFADADEHFEVIVLALKSLGGDLAYHSGHALDFPQKEKVKQESGVLR
jgi:hypothetical protein